jgi:hypothetical protein
MLAAADMPVLHACMLRQLIVPAAAAHQLLWRLKVVEVSLYYFHIAAYTP